jgi:hypothetical protein
MDGLKEIVIDNVELGADVVSTKVPNETDGAGVERRCSHVLALSRPRLPFRYFPSILEPRLQNIDRASPRMSVDEGTEGRFGPSPELTRRETRCLTGNLIVEMDGMAEGKRPKITVIVLRPTEGGKDHHRSTGANGIFDGIFSHSIMMVTADAAVFNALTLGDELRREFLGGIDAVVGAVGANLNADGGSFALKGKFGLHRLSASKSDLVNHRELPTGCIAENRTATEFLSGNVVTTS